MLKSNTAYWALCYSTEIGQFASWRNFYYINADGSRASYQASNYCAYPGCGLRPIIRLRADVTIDGGNGSAKITHINL